MTNNENSSSKIHPEFKVGKLARLAITAYCQSPDHDPAEIERLQNGTYCHETFRLNSTMPVLVRTTTIDQAPEGTHVGESEFYHSHYWTFVVTIDGVDFRVCNDWKESPNPRDNRTPLEDWIRTKGLKL